MCFERSRGPSQERLRTGPGATENAGKVIPARGVMVPLFGEVPGRIRPPLEGLAGGLAVQARSASQWFKKKKCNIYIYIYIYTRTSEEMVLVCPKQMTN